MVFSLTNLALNNEKYIDYDDTMLFVIVVCLSVYSIN